jgi:hypothetical protein
MEEDGLAALLSRFVSGDDRSQELARRIGDVLAEAYPDPEAFPGGREAYEDLEVAAACYRPGGGQFMYDEAQMAAICADAFDRLKRGTSGSPESP